jgi:hypothetical protein
MPYIVDVPLCDGAFTAKAHSRPSHKQIQQITRDTRKRAKEENIEAILVDNLLTLCEGWDVKDENDSPIPWSREGIESAPNDILMELSDKLQQFVQRGSTIDTKLRAIADDMDEDDPRLPKLLELIDAGN